MVNGICEKMICNKHLYSFLGRFSNLCLLKNTLMEMSHF